jgi:hypothetical protein
MIANMHIQNEKLTRRLFCRPNAILEVTLPPVHSRTHDVLKTVLVALRTCQILLQIEGQEQIVEILDQIQKLGIRIQSNLLTICHSLLNK